jgi:flagellar protein FliL
LSKKKLMIIAGPLMLVILLFGLKTFVLGGSAPPDEAALAKAPGPVYTIAEPFVVNLADAGQPHFAKVGVAMRLSELSAPLLLPGEGTGAGPTVEDAAELRDIVIATIQGHTVAQLSRPGGRKAVKRRIIARVNKETELKIVDVYYTEFAVQ